MENDIPLRQFMQPGKTNSEDRLNFVRFWAQYVKTHSDEEWSKQQNIVIDAQYLQLRKALDSLS
ncbi:MAG: hypothetical protein AABX86_02920 [Nanoarchaeota archaeon]